jgi:hypothetical protein
MPASERVRQVQELRRSNAAQPIPSGKVYTRKRKRKGWGNGD